MLRAQWWCCSRACSVFGVKACLEYCGLVAPYPYKVDNYHLLEDLKRYNITAN